MPLYDYACEVCGKRIEVYGRIEHEVPACCSRPMSRLYTGRNKINIKYPLWVDRIDDIHKAQAGRGERLRYVYPKEVGAT